MRKRSLFAILSVIFALSLVTSVSTPVQAAPGHHQQVVLSEDMQFTWYGADNPCGYDLVIHEWGDLRIHYWFDKDGNLTRELDVMGNIKRTMTANDKTLDFQVHGTSSYTIEYQEDIEIYTYKTTGTYSLVTVPGEGIIYGGAGLVVDVYTYDKNTGIWSYNVEKSTGNFNFDDYSQLCAYLGE